MQKRFDAAAARRIGDAVRDVESRSAAELVVEIRSRSGSYTHADARFAAVLTFVSLAALVFMPLVVPPIAVLFDAVAIYVLALGIVRWVPSLRRVFTSTRERLDAVRTHAAALFHDRGIANTSTETGLLLYVSLLEQRMEVLADRGVLRAVEASEWNAALEAVRELEPYDEYSIIAAIRALGTVLERNLPAGAENVDELTSEPGVVH
ncbi:MAG TPA: hypothetical protein VNI54_15505 [Thermoanaerobaculia bacterium]|nr:hypothetical protein [Thermoanaerobaculia bacterium]